MFRFAFFLNFSLFSLYVRTGVFLVCDCLMKFLLLHCVFFCTVEYVFIFFPFGFCK